MEIFLQTPPGESLSWFLCLPTLLAFLYGLYNINGKQVETTKGRTPQLYPYSIPILKSTIPFAFDGLNFLRNVAQYCCSHSVLRIALVHDDLYLVRGPKYVAKLFRTQSLTVTRAYGIVLKHCFGMSQRAVDAYTADTSGSRSEPIEGSRAVGPEQRVSYRTHEILVQGLLGKGLEPATARLEETLARSLSTICHGDEWTQVPDFMSFVESHLGSSVIEVLFGPVLAARNPDFVRDLWAYDKQIMNLARRLPRFLIPNAYRLRDKLRECVKDWHLFARTHTKADGHTTSADEGDGSVAEQLRPDSLWGSAMMRERHEMLLTIQSQDFDSVASTDLALLWATVTNVVPSSANLALQAFRDPALLAEVRTSIAPAHQRSQGSKFDLKVLEKQPLLLSMYAETLRFSVQIFVPRASPHKQLMIGHRVVPENGLVMVNTWLAHSDEDIWNTRQGQYPLDDFWARRFLLDPDDPLSGPVKRHYPLEKMPVEREPTSDTRRKEPVRFSTDGLEGSWIPYGGGHHACPGRLLAKRIMLLFCAMLVRSFDIEILADGKALAYTSPRFGFGVRKPSGKVPFRIRKRTESL